jgi:hypothetical protein
MAFFATASGLMIENVLSIAMLLLQKVRIKNFGALYACGR